MNIFGQPEPKMVLIAAVYTRIKGVTRVRTIQTTKEAKK